MSLTSHVIIRQAYARIGAFTGDAAQIATAYSGALSGLNTESFPLQSMNDMLVLVENEIANAVASNENHPWRSLMQDTVTVAAGGVIPSFGSTTAQKIIGVYGQVRSATSPFRQLTPALHEDEIRAITQFPTLFKSSYFSYALRPPRIYPTVSSVSIDVCVFDYDARQTAIDANGALLFQSAEGAYFSGLMSNLANEDSLLQSLSKECAPSYANWLESLQAGRDMVAEAAA